MIQRLFSVFEPFILSLLATVTVATVLPARGGFAVFAGYMAEAGIVLLFFLHGAKLSREAIWTGLRNWPLHLAVLASTFILFPLLGLGMARLPGVDPSLAMGILFLTLLPSTVQSSIAFTAIARGNVAAAICSASFSNLLGILVTPALVALLMKVEGGAGVSLASVEGILLQLLAPFVAGHLLRPWIGGFVGRHKSLLTVVDRGSILLVVYTAFGAAVVEGLWTRVSPGDLGRLFLLCLLLLGVILAATYMIARVMRLSPEDAIVLQFCGSKKSLASGVPMAGVLFPAAQVGVILLPVMLFHQIQLIACAMLARHYGQRSAAESEEV
ncbi:MULTISPECIES: bile acid:sodium symporter family protein [Sphingomonas]|jgi:solute carrier family 10 (sodium/bile acid cotransporter), member 7|uniref:Bile acid:sodium symporter n=1 Tax=Sphingomonas zeae TaxID=1646122 RepID=A0A7Y6B1W9_9SPHN|nr:MULTISPECIES: bile acid:sodium symporter family protein [Sphingomonas]MBB4049523.1 sodium/bile acid cotransporter 7 [Sphingomonas zeae]MDK8187676.1 bile acid:sodium symporter family protein [Sphingomonas zeae]MDK8217471.1 bile acid:sodium symporter family protein [Sphingomonas sp. UMB7805-LC452B]NUU45910.1 bile acid:sodium symporter [Sphingomonas zeae]